MLGVALSAPGCAWLNSLWSEPPPPPAPPAQCTFTLVGSEKINDDVAVEVRIFPVDPDQAKTVGKLNFAEMYAEEEFRYTHEKVYAISVNQNAYVSIKLEPNHTAVCLFAKYSSDKDAAGNEIAWRLIEPVADLEGRWVRFTSAGVAVHQPEPPSK
jgi:predicted component of type VI protein secretion system